MKSSLTKTAAAFFFVYAGDTFDLVEEAAESSLGRHGCEVAVGQNFQMGPPDLLEFLVEHVAFENACCEEVQVAGDLDCPSIGWFAGSGCGVSSDSSSDSSKISVIAIHAGISAAMRTSRASTKSGAMVSPGRTTLEKTSTASGSQSGG